MRKWQFKWINTWDEVWGDAFVSRWQTLMGKSPSINVFFEPAIVRAWYETYRNLRNIEPRFLIANCDEGCEVFFPLIYDKGGWKDGWRNVLYAAGQFEFDYHDPIVSKDLPDEVKSSFWTAFRERVAGLRDRIDIISIPRIRDVWVSESSSLLRPVAKAPFINLTKFKTFEDYVPVLHKLLRREVRRQPRRLRELGSLELKVIDKVDRALKILPQLEKLRSAKWPLANRTKDFYSNLVKFGLESGVVQLSVLELDGRALSFALGFRRKRRFYAYVWVFDPTLAKYSPGKVHQAMLINEAIKQRLEAFDLLLGEEDYKLKWANGSTDLYENKWNGRGIGSIIRNRSWQILQAAAAMKKRLSVR